MRIRSIVITVVVFTAVLGGAWALQPGMLDGFSPRLSEDSVSSPSRADTPHASAHHSVGSAAQSVTMDPQTREFLAVAVPVPPGVVAFSTSHEGLYEEISPIPGGGVMVHLQGRFQSVLSAVENSDGSITITHQRPSANSAANSGGME